MKILKELTEKEVGLETVSVTEPLKLREAARAVLFDAENKVALLHVTKHNYHKLPGGGIESGEDIKIALTREVMEEVGCQIEVGEELGQIIEYKNGLQEKQISYCFTAKVVGEKGNTSFTEEEREEGLEPQWMDLNEAIETLEKDEPNNYVGKFIQQRDLIFLNEARNRQI